MGDNFARAGASAGAGRSSQPPRSGGAGNSGARPVHPGWWVLLGAGLVLLLAGLWSLLGAGGADAGRLGKGCVGVMSIDGEIVASDSPDTLLSAGQVGSETIAQEISDAGSRSDVKALVVVVNSPGGSVVASREIYQALSDVKKPKVAYFREVAASGGYYLSQGADYIVSDPDALTGSIGAEATFTDLSGLFGKLGVNQSEIKSGEFKDIGIPSRPMTNEEKALMQGVVDQIFGEFRDTVNASRGKRLNQTAFAQVLDARILTGKQAYAIGLVDQLGTKQDAIDQAARMAGDESLPVCDLDYRQPGLLSQLLGGALEPILPAAGMGRWRLSY
ncbi:MAG: signal peptide peptidase SppA [Candidatus Micrarchaeota archaeon]|nr:signal peptide peptidase SppA [Candidatus Micrarchaeota archaeon]